MDHDEVREELELAAAEPGGIDRLMAGDTPLAGAVAAHLAGCDACTEELVRLRRAARLIRATVRSTPPADLRERTLAYVGTHGRVGPLGAPAVEPEPARVPRATGEAVQEAARAAPVAMTPPISMTEPRDADRRLRRLGWVAGMAAAIAVAVLGTSAVIDARYGERLAAEEAGAARLSRVTAAAVALSAADDVTQVRLASTPDTPAGSDMSGSLSYSAASSELVVIASGLVEPASDREYRCWVEVNGSRTAVGKMFFGGELAFWAGQYDGLARLETGTTFGVSLVDAAGDTLDTPPVLAGVVE